MNTVILIRNYVETDWQDLCDIHDLARMDELKKSAGEAAFLSLEQTYKSEGLFDDKLFVACLNDKPVGFAALADNELTWLYVHPNKYRQGIGRKLLRKIIEECDGKMTISVLVGNESALKLYLSEGFKIKEIKKGKLVGNESFDAEGIFLERE